MMSQRCDEVTIGTKIRVADEVNGPARGTILRARVDKDRYQRASRPG